MLKLRIKLFIYRLKMKFKDWWNWLWAHIAAGMLVSIKFLPAKPSIAFFANFASLIGPMTPRHQVALKNLRAAFPEKDDKEIKSIAREMWRNMGRLFAEYVFLDEIFDFDPTSDKPGFVEVEGEEIFKRIRDENKPHIFFTAHTGNFELLPICAATYDLDVMALFRPPNNPYIAKRVLKARRTKMGHLVPSKAGSAWVLAGRLQESGNVGMLVDQKFRRGLNTTFFNLPVKTNPLLAKLARQYDCDVYPARCIRLPEGRYKLQLFDKVDLPKNAEGAIDINASVQLINDIVENWVREYPGQWMWFHKRWEK
ncbi:lipid A biosynthesis lauroyl acyltransferase [Bartonella sp. HY406]|uniref:lipid A biosynthesis lauroyl acyltransferase n=1 Tax=Bartonella sp. HY406 TaxID=2979331 RepID=UPI0021C5C9A7|nr:lipid A biosynthesis lauroyl acyltransferase [Bartonella sp. HY406]UXN04602.1 lipid A biosynthesis lauroyl acyltransferase [Bartonella sp. HY406]